MGVPAQLLKMRTKRKGFLVKCAIRLRIIGSLVLLQAAIIVWTKSLDPAVVLLPLNVMQHPETFKNASSFRSKGKINIPNITQPTAHPFSSKQYVRYNRRKTKLVMKPIHEVYRTDLIDLNDDDHYAINQNNFNDSREAKSEILNLLYKAGITHIDNETVALLPTWKNVEDMYGNISEDQPLYIAGLETCSEFRHPKKNTPRYSGEAMLGTAGLFNTGTNALTYYLRANLQLLGLSDHEDDPRWRRHHGILYQVPWDKHFLPSLRYNHTAKYMESYSKEQVMPIVMIRDPFTWVHSMCSTPYMVQFGSSSFSKNITSNPQKQLQCLWSANTNETSSSSSSFVSIPAMTNRTWPSLFHLWNDWYNEYLQGAFNEPFLMVRFEDLLFRPHAVVDQIRQCVNASWQEENVFTYVVDHSKWEHIRFHGPQSNRISAMIKHGDPQRRRKGMTDHDLRRAQAILDPELMKMFGYTIPT